MNRSQDNVTVTDEGLLGTKDPLGLIPNRRKVYVVPVVDHLLDL